jgi:hypothetical protein
MSLKSAKDFKIHFFVMRVTAYDTQAWPHLELKTRARFSPVILIIMSLQVFNIDHMHCDKTTELYFYKPKISSFIEGKVGAPISFQTSKS